MTRHLDDARASRHGPARGNARPGRRSSAPGFHGTEIIVLAARDLIGTTAAWTQEAYDLLTRPWAEASGQPAHPADIILPQRP